MKTKGKFSIYAFANQLRRTMTYHEEKLYNSLLYAMRDFREVPLAQKAIGPFIADFLIEGNLLIVEVDGHSHIARRDYDSSRDKYLHNRGYRVIRFTNEEVARDCERVTREILSQCKNLRPRDMDPENPIATLCPPATRAQMRARARRRYV